MPAPCYEASCLSLTLGGTTVGRVELSHRLRHFNGPATSGSFAISLRTAYSTFNDRNTLQSRFSDSRLYEVPFHPRRWLKDCCMLNDREVFDFFDSAT